MNREIKFRLGFPNNGNIYWQFLTLDEIRQGKCAFNNRKPVIENQFTGLKDKNDIDIYEGDILIGNTYAEREDDIREWTKEQPCIVEYSNGCFTPFYLSTRWRCDLENIEVIGNIYETPELLEQKIKQ